MTRLEAAVDSVLTRPLDIDGVHVWSDEHGSVERHHGPDLRRDVFSASKTVVSLAVGIAEAEGALTVDDPVLAHLGHLTARPAAGVERVTVRHLLTMTSGIGYRWADPDGDHPGDAAADILATSLATEPGSAFAYRGANTYLLGRIVHAATGENLRDYLDARLFAPLGIANPQWHRDPLGHPLGAVGLHLRTEELARVGRLLLDRGRAIVPASWVDAMTDDAVPTDGHVASRAPGPHPETARYGRHVWLCARDGAWRMDGIYGQFAVVLPQHRACVTVTARYEGATTDILDAVWSDIVPTLS